MIGAWQRIVERIQNRTNRSRLMRWSLRIAAMIALLSIGGLLVSASGVIPITASSGHSPMTRWFLEFSKQRSVATHSIGLKAPRLDEPRLILQGATHYEVGCRSCHGSPEHFPPKIAQAMEPAPPHLSRTVSKWSPEELFYIVKHGIKFTGMPAWPSQERDDEVWAMVAFLQTLPEMDAEHYRQLVHGETRQNIQLVVPTNWEGASTAVIESCTACHGSDGLGREDAFPKLAGQRPEYLAASLEAFARGQRHSGTMEPIAAGLNSKQMNEFARYYASLKLPATPYGGSTQAIERGQAIARRGIPSQDVPACAACHGPSDVLRNPNYPLLAGQPTDYLILQLTLFKQAQRGGTAYGHLMRPVAAGLSAEQMRDVALYYAALNPNGASQED